MSDLKITLNSDTPVGLPAGKCDSPLEIWKGPQVDCPKHGITSNVISSNIAGHEGHWCQICWVETLGPSLPLVK